MSHAYATSNAFNALAVSAFSWSTASTADRDALNDGRMDKVCASGNGTTTITLDINRGGTTSLVGIALLGHNLAALGATVTVASDNNAGFTSPATVKAATTVDTAAPREKETLLLFPSVTEQYIRLTFTAAGTFSVELGEVYGLAAYTTLTRLKAYGWGETEDYITNNVQLSAGVERRSFLAGPIRNKSLPFSDLNPTEKAEVMSMWRATKGGCLDLLWMEAIGSSAVAATNDEQECLWGKLKPSLGWTEPDFQLYSPATLELRSLGRKVGQ